MLDNRAVPRYYGQFREDVLRGKQIVNENIALQMNLIDDLIDDPAYYYDEDAVEGFIALCEEELTLTDGEDFFMTEPFKLWAEDVYGWYEFEERDVYIPHPEGHGGHFERKQIKRRLRKKQYIIVPTLFQFINRLLLGNSWHKNFVWHYEKEQSFIYSRRRTPLLGVF